MRPDSSQVAGRVLLTKSVVRLQDALTDPDYDQRFARAIGFRRLLGVPMLREGDPLGVIVAGWLRNRSPSSGTAFAPSRIIQIRELKACSGPVCAKRLTDLGSPQPCAD
jgi:GAF domain-containing protein